MIANQTLTYHQSIINQSLTSGLWSMDGQQLVTKDADSCMEDALNWIRDSKECC